MINKCDEVTEIVADAAMICDFSVVKPSAWTPPEIAASVLSFPSAAVQIAAGGVVPGVPVALAGMKTQGEPLVAVSPTQFASAGPGVYVFPLLSQAVLDAHPAGQDAGAPLIQHCDDVPPQDAGPQIAFPHVAGLVDEMSTAWHVASANVPPTRKEFPLFSTVSTRLPI